MSSLFIKKAIIGIILIILLSPSFVLAISGRAESRLNFGIHFFRSILSSDKKLAEKVSSVNQLNIALIRAKDLSKPKEIAEKLLNAGHGKSKGKVGRIPLNISITTAEKLSTSKYTPLAGIFLTDKLSKQQLTTIINYGISHQIIVFSPFEGDVQAGILVGLDVSIDVRPYINRKTLKKTQLPFKAVFIKLAKFYED